MHSFFLEDTAFRIRDAQTPDLVNVFEIEKRVFAEDKFDILLLRELMTKAVTFTAVENLTSEKVIAFCIVMEVEPDNWTPVGKEKQDGKRPPDAHIVNFAVDVPFQRKGVGKRLLDFTLQKIEARGFLRVQLEVNIANHPALALYQHRGFARIEMLPNYYKSGADAYRMTKILQNN